MTVTIKQVAREAGVSVATVSRALNGTGPVREAVQVKVRAVAERLRYVPHGAARSLITKKTNTVGVVLPDIFGEFFSEVIRGLDGVCRHSGYHLLVAGSHSDAHELAAVLRATRGRVDGLVLMAPDVDADALERNAPANVPLVVLNCRLVGARFDSISIDNYGGAYALVQHLLGLGHRRISFIGGPARNFEASERLRGYRDALSSLEGAQAAELETEGDFSEEAGYRGVKALLDVGRRPTAIFAANDAMALGALAALHELAIRVPDDMTVVGFDDIPVSRYVSPPLASVHVPIAELGTRAMERLLAAFEHGAAHEHRHEVLPTTLVVRGSCAAPRSPSSSISNQVASSGRLASNVRERRKVQ